MIVLGIDSAPAKTGWALVTDGVDSPDRAPTVLARGIEGTLFGSDMLKLIRTMSLDYLCTYGDSWKESDGKQIDVAVIEGPYLDKNVRTHEMLSRYVGRWECALDVAGIGHEVIKAQSWQTGILGRALLGGPRATRAHRKKAAKIWVRATYGIGVSEDEADAIGLATYVLRRETFRKRCASAA